jgi:hypothetical protein|nr:MAG TPA: hypothetical protein [Caudoviricetes sp.]
MRHGSMHRMHLDGMLCASETLDTKQKGFAKISGQLEENKIFDSMSPEIFISGFFLTRFFWVNKSLARPWRPKEN